MATHLSFEADLKTTPRGHATAQSTSVRQPNARPPLQWKTAGNAKLAMQELDSSAATHGMRRIMTREQGCAIEMIGHAIDYLNDCYINEGDDDEILDFNSQSMDAVRILISAQRQILRSLPLTEPLSVRIWNTLRRRKSQMKSSAVVRLSSSR